MSLQKIYDGQSQRCRACLRKESNMIFIHDIVQISSIEISLAQAISLCTSIEIAMNDLFPQHLCQTCRDILLHSYEFRLQCEKTNEFLKKELITNTTKININDDIQEPENKVICGTEQKSAVIIESISFNEIKTEVNIEECERREQIDKTSVNENKILNNGNDILQTTEDFGLKFRRAGPHQKRILKSERNLPKLLENNECEQCRKRFKSKSTLREHKKKHAPEQKTCKYCDYMPETPAKFALHMEEQHQDLKTISCKECGKKFFKKINLRYHLLVHTGIKSHTCEICGLSFALSGNLKQHKRRHTGEKPYTCSHCGKSFRQHSTLRSHEACHSDERKYVCSECGAMFTRRDSLRKHKKRHLGNRPHSCSFCKKAFKTITEMKSHEQIHSGVKNHVCEVCSKRFIRKTHLKVHMRTHTGETPHLCQICGKGFSQAHCLRTHLKTIHKECRQ